MRLGTRVQRLEKWTRRGDHNCKSCGRPDRIVRRIIFSPTRDPMPTCPECGGPLNFDGLPLGVPCTRIILDRSPRFTQRRDAGRAQGAVT